MMSSNLHDPESARAVNHGSCTTICMEDGHGSSVTLFFRGEMCGAAHAMKAAFDAYVASIAAEASNDLAEALEATT